jgi:CheY-like chemotaxis protein
MDRYRILIVDDHHDVRRMLHAWVQTLGPQYEALAMPSGEEAILDASRQPVDLLIADFRLPGITGLELMAKIKRRYPNLKVILITGMTDPKVRRQVAEAGADAFFIKPVEMPDFLDAVERLLGTVETLLPPAPIVQEIPQPSKGPLECLADLRQALHAVAACLLDDYGEIQASAGHLPEEYTESNLILALTAAHQAGLKVSYALGIRVPRNLMFFKGRQYHFCIALVGSSHNILLAFDASQHSDFPPSGYSAVFQAAQEILESLNRVSKAAPPLSGETPETPVEEGFPVEVVETVLLPQEEELQPEPVDVPDLNEIFKKEEAALDSQAVDNFWDAAVEQNDDAGAGSASALSYDEARRLGLAPQDEEPS